ncbi:MAG: 16S rRNA processing protein RimM [Tissierellia bacterium]|nr:16S rRNA processing protein RimM [Tissierellia bacterium]
MILVGKTTKTVGLKGEIKLFILEPDLLEIGGVYCLGNKSHSIEKLRFVKNAAIIKFSGIDTIEEAQKHLQKELTRKKEDVELEEDEFFYSDLLGVKVFDEQGKALGEIVDILQPSSQNIYVIRGETEFLLPGVKEFILSIDMEKRQMIVSLIEGLK